MGKCYWAYEDGQKFWIPGCHLAIYQDCGPCHCREWEKEQAKLHPSEEKEYKKLNRQLLKENERLIKVIDELKSKSNDL